MQLSRKLLVGPSRKVPANITKTPTASLKVTVDLEVPQTLEEIRLFADEDGLELAGAPEMVTETVVLINEDGSGNALGLAKALHITDAQRAIMLVASCRNGNRSDVIRATVKEGLLGLLPDGRAFRFDTHQFMRELERYVQS